MSWRRRLAEGLESLGLERMSYRFEYRDGDRNYPQVHCEGYTIQGWNGMVLKDGKVVRQSPKRRVWWNGGGDHLTFSDGSSRFNTHMRHDSRNMIGNEVIEDLAGPSVEKKFPQHYVRLEDGREGVSTEGLSRDALKTIYRETGQAEGGAGDPRPDLMDKLRKRAQASAKKAGVEL